MNTSIVTVYVLIITNNTLLLPSRLVHDNCLFIQVFNCRFASEKARKGIFLCALFNVILAQKEKSSRK